MLLPLEGVELRTNFCTMEVAVNSYRMFEKYDRHGVIQARNLVLSIEDVQFERSNFLVNIKPIISRGISTKLIMICSQINPYYINIKLYIISS